MPSEVAQRNTVLNRLLGLIGEVARRERATRASGAYCQIQMRPKGKNGERQPRVDAAVSYFGMHTQQSNVA